MEFNNQNKERKVITAEEFLKLLAETSYLEGYRINDDLFIDDSIIIKSTNQLVFNNCYFDYIELKNIGYQIEVIFKNCTVNNLIIPKYSKKSKDINATLLRLSIYGNSEIKSLFFSNHPSIEVNFSDSTIVDIGLTDCYFPKLNFKRITFKDIFVIQDSKMDLVKFEECVFEKYFTFNNSKVTDQLSLVKSLFKDQFFFSLCKESPESSRLKINIESCETHNRFMFLGQNANIQKLFSNKHIGQLEVNDMIITSTEIQGSYEKDATHRFNNCSFNNFKCICTNSHIHLSSIKSFGDKSTFAIRSSDLNNTSLFDVNLQSFDKVVIEKSDFTNMTTSRVTWFEDKQLKTAFQSENEDPYERREFYRQLKYNQEKQGNKIQALTFQSLEMQYYSQELNPKSFLANLLLKNKFVAFFGHFILAFTSQNRFILWIGKSNNHGQSFLKPLAFLLVLGLIFNFLILQSASPQSTFELLFKKGSLKMLPSLLNPVHDISKLLHVEEPSFWTNMLDLLWKVIEATLIFQTITAFRKHVRV